MQLADPARPGAGRLTGVKPGQLGRALERRLDRQCLVQGLHRALGAEVPSFADAPEVPALVGKRHRAPGCRRARSRTAQCSSLSASRLWRRRPDQPFDERRAQDRLVGRQRLGQPHRLRVRVLGDEAPGVGLGEAAADHHVLDEPSQPLLLAEPAEHLPPLWQRERHVAEAECGPPPRSDRPRA